MKDGDVDYSGYCLSELREIESYIDGQKNPKNFSNLQIAIAKLSCDDPIGESPNVKPDEDAFIWLFPRRVETSDHIRKALNTGAIACAIVAVVTVAAVSYSVFMEPILGLDEWSYIDAVLFAICGYGIFRGSRIAGFFALGIFVAARYFMFVDEGKFGGALSIFILAMMITGIRGAFAHHRRIRGSDSPAVVEPD